MRATWATSLQPQTRARQVRARSDLPAKLWPVSRDVLTSAGRNRYPVQQGISRDRDEVRVSVPAGIGKLFLKAARALLKGEGQVPSFTGAGHRELDFLWREFALVDRGYAGAHGDSCVKGGAIPNALGDLAIFLEAQPQRVDQAQGARERLFLGREILFFLFENQFVTTQFYPAERGRRGQAVEPLVE